MSASMDSKLIPDAGRQAGAPALTALNEPDGALTWP